MSKKIFIIVIVVLIAFIAVRVATYFVRPVLEERFLKAVKEKLGGDIELSKFDISIPRSIVKLEGFKITDSKLTKYQYEIAAEEIVLDIDLPGTILRREPVFQRIYLINPFLNLKNAKKQISQNVAIPSGHETSGAKKPLSNTPSQIKFDNFYIKKLIVKNFKFTFTDYTVPSPPAVIDVINIDGRLDDFSMSLLEGGDFRGTVHVSGKIHSKEKGQVKLGGTFNRIKEGVDFDFKLDLKNLDLTYFSPYYSNTSFTILEEAKVDMSSSATCMQDKLDASQDVRIYDIKLRKSTPDSEDTLFGLPAATVIDFFKDSKGDVRFSFNIKGMLDDPKFDPGPLIKQVLSNALRNKIASKIERLPKEVIKIGENALNEGLEVGKKLKTLDKDADKVIKDIKKELKKIIDYQP